MSAVGDYTENPTDVYKPVSKLKQVSLIFACGTALFSDGYANGIIGSVNTLLKRQYYNDYVAHSNYGTTLSSLAFAGTIVGQLSFGYISDKVGRKFGMMTATGIVALFSALSAGSYGVGGGFSGIAASLSAYRFLLGIGVGAEYPCGSVAASEQSEGEAVSKNAQHRWFALATNSMIDTGFVIAAFVPLVLVWIFGENHLNVIWRMSLGLGVVPALAVLLWRLRMVEPVAYQKNSMKHQRTPYWLTIKRYWLQLIAISLIWFMYDFISYPFGLYGSTVVADITGNSTALTVVFGWNVVINLFYIPGTVGGAFAVDYLGPKNTIIIGLVAQAIVGFIMSGLYSPLTKHIGAFAVVYGIFLSLGEFGPGNCLGLISAKTWPTAVRGQFYGIAAAIGKCGAFAGTWAFPPLITAFSHHGANVNRGQTGPFWVGSAMAALSAIIALAFLKPLDHDGMAAEDLAFREYLERNGFDTSAMGMTEKEIISDRTDESLNSDDEKEKEKSGAAPVGHSSIVVPN